MQRKPNIKWRDSDEERLNRQVANFNAKINRIIKKNPSMSDVLPSKISKKEMKSKIQTRADFNRELKSLQRFSKRGSEKVISNDKGLSVTAWEKKEIGIKVANINRRKAREYKQANINPTQKGIVGSLKENMLRPKNINFGNKTKKEWEKFVQSVDVQISSTYADDRAETYKQNYLNIIDEFLGTEGKALREFIENLPAEFIYRNYYEDAVMQIQFISEPLPVDVIVESALERWKSALASDS